MSWKTLNKSMNRPLQFFIHLTILLLAFAPAWAQDRSDILIIGHDALGGTGANPIQIRADRDGNILWQKPLPLLNWGDSRQFGDRNQREDTFYLTSHQEPDKIDGKNRLIKLDSNGDVVWDLPLSTAEIYVSANPVDGGVYAFERSPENKLHKFDGDGNLIWTLNDFAATRLSTDPTSGGIYISKPPNDVLKLSTDGAVIWSKTLPGSSGRVEANPIDGGVYVGWNDYGRNTYRLDADGNIMWSKFSFPSNWTYGRSVSPLDGSLFIGSGWAHRLAHIALDGTVLFNIPALSYVPNLATAIDEMAVYIGDYAEFGIQKYDGAGNLMWQKLYGPSSWIGRYGIMNVYTGMPAVANDDDGDGVYNDEDVCPDTVIPEGVPTVELNPNHWALIDDNFEFDTVIKGKGKGPGRSYTTADTAGCSCEQIIEALGLGGGHMKYGCSIGAMDDWVELVNP